MKLFDLEEVEAMIEARRRRERWWKPGIWMLKALKRKIKDARREVRYAHQRVFRGWDDRAVWALDDHLAKTLGQQLVAMSGILHGYPDGYEPEKWAADLKKHGEALIAYQKLHYEVYGMDFEAVYQPAQQALVWVSENLASLWD